MLGILLKKQLMEIFRAYFYDAKKNRLRSKWAMAGWFLFFVLLLGGFGGGMFIVLSLSMCAPMHDAGVGWLYFLLLGGMAVLLGAFGSVFNTYTGLYLSRDNDLLLSLPIPAETIIRARLAGVYLMGTLFSGVALVPTLAVRWAVVGVTASGLLCGLLFFLLVTVIVLLLSCLLGWGVARLSLKLKNKSFITVLLALAFLGAYYFFYFRATALLRDLIEHSADYGARIKGAAYVLYLFGRVGEGDWLAALLYAAAAALLACLVWLLLKRSFFQIAAAGGGGGKARYREKSVRAVSPFAALLRKELGRFTASPSYMLNCGLGVLFLPLSGVLLLVKGGELCGVLEKTLGGRTGCVPVLLSAALCLVNAMNDMAAPAVSLEGKCLWIPQSLPVTGKTVLRAKAALQLLLTEVPMLFAALCAAVVAPASLAVKLLVFLTPLLCAWFSAAFCAVIGVRLPILSWTNELAPIKQSAGALIAIFGSWILCVLFAGLYLAAGYLLGPAAYLLLWAALFALAGLLLFRWLFTRGAEIFRGL